MSCLIVFRSITQSRSAASIFHKNKIASVETKPPVELGRGSCSFGLMIPGQRLPAALSLLQKTTMQPLGIYENMGGRWREVMM